jgi:hypothetical protein
MKHSKPSQKAIRKKTMTTNGLRKVQYYDDLLEALQRALPGSPHIAGGAVRDTLLERQIRDIDIFVRDGVTSNKAADLLRSDFGYVKVGEWTRYEDFSDPMVARVAKFEKADETIPICLIGLKEDLSPYDNIARFDFGVCMAAWSGGHTTIITDDRFKRDIESKTFTLYRADNLAQFSYSMVRFEKLTADRYKGWTLAIADQFEELVREHTFRSNWYRYEQGAHFGFENYSQSLRPKAR